MSIMSTLGIKPPGGCHYPPQGYEVMARLITPVVEHYTYHTAFDHPVTPADVQRAYYTSARHDRIALQFDQPVVWKPSLTSEFYLDGAAGKIASGDVSGDVLTLKLKQPSDAKTIKYIDGRSWSQDRLLVGRNGIAALTFCHVPIGSARPSR